jgi:hypothetical protein
VIRFFDDPTALKETLIPSTPPYHRDSKFDSMLSPKPKNEKQRLKVLWQYDVLDTVPEEVFDELTDLAAHICEAPIALISLIDEGPSVVQVQDWCNHQRDLAGHFVLRPCDPERRPLDCARRHPGRAFQK